MFSQSQSRRVTSGRCLSSVKTAEFFEVSRHFFTRPCTVQIRIIITTSLNAVMSKIELFQSSVFDLPHDLFMKSF